MQEDRGKCGEISITFPHPPSPTRAPILLFELLRIRPLDHSTGGTLT